MLLGAPSTGRGAELHLVHTPGEFQEALDIAAQNGDDDVIFVAPGTYNLTSTLRYAPAADEEYGLAIGGYTIYDIPLINGGMMTQIMSIDYHCDADWNDFGASVLISDLIFEMGYGPHGGLFVHRKHERVSIVNNRFRLNQSTLSDGGVAAVGVVTNRGEIRFINNIVANNTGGGTGGAALMTYGGRVLAINNTVMHNLGDGVGGFYGVYQSNDDTATDAHWIIANNIVWANETRSGARDHYDLYTHARILRDDDPLFAVQNNALGVDTSLGAGEFDLDGHDASYNPYSVTDNHHGDPGVRLDYHLSAGSPCIDRGLNRFGSGRRLPPADHFHSPRIVDGDGDGDAIADIGASEYGVSTGDRKRYQYVPGKPDQPPAQADVPVVYLPLDDLVINPGKEVGWRMSIRRTSPRSLGYAMHFSDASEAHYGADGVAGWGALIIPGVEVPGDGSPAFGFDAFMDVRAGEEQDVLSVLVNGVTVWRKDAQNVSMRAWQPIQVDLSQYRGQKVEIAVRFDMLSGGDTQGEGVYVDELHMGRMPSPNVAKIEQAF